MWTWNIVSTGAETDSYQHVQTTLLILVTELSLWLMPVELKKRRNETYYNSHSVPIQFNCEGKIDSLHSVQSAQADSFKMSKNLKQSDVTIQRWDFYLLNTNIFTHICSGNCMAKKSGEFVKQLLQYPLRKRARKCLLLR